MVFVGACGRKGRALAGFGWACVRKGKDWIGWVWLGLCMERKGFGWGRGPLANKVWIQPRSLAGSAPRPCEHEDLQEFATTGGWDVSCGSAGHHSQAAAGSAQQSSVRALPHAYRRSSGPVRVLDVRIDWHVKRSTNNKFKRRAVRRQAGEGLAGRRQ